MLDVHHVDYFLLVKHGHFTGVPARFSYDAFTIDEGKDTHRAEVGDKVVGRRLVATRRQVGPEIRVVALDVSVLEVILLVERIRLHKPNLLLLLQPQFALEFTLAPPGAVLLGEVTEAAVDFLLQSLLATEAGYRLFVADLAAELVKEGELAHKFPVVVIRLDLSEQSLEQSIGPSLSDREEHGHDEPQQAEQQEEVLV